MLNGASPSFEASSLEGTATAIGGNAGAASGGANLSAPSAGGDATAVANLAGAGDVTANAVAQGGAGSLAPLGINRPGGGQATANATALATGGHAATALASATGGSLAGFGVNLVNAATASAYSGSGTVTVTAIQTGGSSPIMTLDQYDLVGGTGAGGNSALVTQSFGSDAALAVSGSTSGTLILNQTAIGGNGFGAGGAATSELTIVNSTASVLKGYASATGGASGELASPQPPDNIEGADPGGMATATASVSSTIGAAVTASAIQIGGNGGNGVLGDVAGAGANSTMNNAASGSTTGALTLDSKARSAETAALPTPRALRARRAPPRRPCR